MKIIIKDSHKIFIAGGTGMVGSSLKRAFYKKFPNKTFIEENILTPSRKELDLSDSIKVERWFKRNKPEIVILAAAKVGGILANSKYPADFLIQNLKIQNNVIQSSFSNNVKKFVFLGSSCIYPKLSSQPIKEEYLLTNYLESTNESYAIAKIAGMKLVEALRTQYDFDAISLMPPNLYGPNDNYHPQNSHVMPALIRKFLLAKEKNLPSVSCWGSGNVEREFMHVDDLAKGIIFCIENWDPNSNNAPKDCNGKILNHLNIGTGRDITIKNLAKKISNIIKFRGDILWDKSKPDGTPKKLLDVSRLNRLGWKATIDINEGIKQTIKNLDILSL